MSSVLTVNDLRVAFYTYYGVVRAVNGVSLSIDSEETLGLVGESGSGKSVSAAAVMGLIPPPGVIIGGEVILRGRDLFALSPDEWSHIRGSEISMCFQNPMRALNPVLRVGEQIMRVHLKHMRTTKREARRHSVELLKAVNIPDAERVMARYPHQLSGGMCQRVMIVMALMCDPVLLILDEPTTGLDVTVQKQLLHLLQQLRHETAASQLMITHDLGVIANICDRVTVMYAGQVMEEADVGQLFERPKHPYTQTLLESIPQVDERNVLNPIPGSVPDALNLPSGCPFHPRCMYAMEVCRVQSPALHEFPNGQRAACHLYDGKESDDKAT